MNIVYGGSFNPPTMAHLNIIKKLLDTFNGSSIIILPVGDDYNKSNLVDFNHRSQMISLMIKPFHKSVSISDLEQQKGFRGTIGALNELSKSYNNLHFVIGSDHLNSLKTWIDYKELLKSYPLIVMNRNHYMTIDEAEKLFQMIDHEFKFIEFDMEISSTEIRQNVEQHKHSLNKEVYEYIKKHKLYEGK